VHKRHKVALEPVVLPVYMHSTRSAHPPYVRLLCPNILGVIVFSKRVELFYIIYFAVFITINNIRHNL
jgi:hypothetical protein